MVTVIIIAITCLVSILCFTGEVIILKEDVSSSR